MRERAISSSTKESPIGDPLVPWGSLDFFVFCRRESNERASSDWAPPGIRRVDRVLQGRVRVSLLVSRDAAIADHDGQLIVSLGPWPDPPSVRISILQDGVEIATDNTGTNQIYSKHRLATEAVVTSRIELLLDNDSRLNVPCLEEMLAIGFPLRHETLFEEIRRVPGSSVLRLKMQGASLGWEVESTVPVIEPSTGTDDSIESLSHHLASRCDSGTIFEISGGVDSRLCLALAIHAGMKDLRLFTLGRRGSADVDSAAAIAKHISADHIVIDPESLHPSPVSVRDARAMVASAGFMLNFIRYHRFPLVFRDLSESRTSQVTGFGGEHFIDMFRVPFDSLVVRERTLRRALLSLRFLHSSNGLSSVWSEREGLARLRGVIGRLDSRLANFEGSWGEKTGAFFRGVKHPNLSGFMTTASSRWYRVIGPLLSGRFRRWAQADRRRRSRAAHRNLIQRLAPGIAGLPYQSDLERRAPYRRGMHGRSNGTLGKIALRLAGRRTDFSPKSVEAIEPGSVDTMISSLEERPELETMNFDAIHRVGLGLSPDVLGTLMTLSLAVEASRQGFYADLHRRLS